MPRPRRALFLLGPIGKGWLRGSLDYNGSVVANVEYRTYTKSDKIGLWVISMSDQSTSEDKPSNIQLYILGGMATLIVLMWFLTHLWW